jgi:CDP-ribitol ribitolphosphotransferase
VLYPVWYFLASKRKIRYDKYIFVENHLEQLSDNFRLIYDRLEKEGAELKVYYLKIRQGNWLYTVRESLALLWDMGNAFGVFLSESNSLFGVIPLRRETELIQLWHACGAFKKWGRSVADKSFGEDARELERYDGHRNYSLVPVSGQEVCWVYEEAFGLENTSVVKPLGVSRTDVYFDDEKRLNAKRHLQEVITWKGERKVILYAPTFRGDINQAKTPEKMDYDRLYTELGDEYVVLIKNHPFVQGEFEIPEKYRDFLCVITDELHTDELLLSADVLITDYSSVIFEYALLERPMIFFAYDLEEYYDERGFYYPYREFVPGPVVENTEQLLEVVNHLEHIDMQLIRKFKDKYMSGCDGHATDRLLENMKRLKEEQEERHGK